MITIRKKPRRPQRTQSKRVSLRSLRSLRFLLFVAVFSVSPAAQAPQQPATVFRSGTELVLVNVVVRDKSGAVVRGLTRDDFSVSEDDKAQSITSFDFEELDAPSLAENNGPFATSVITRRNDANRS